MSLAVESLSSEVVLKMASEHHTTVGTMVLTVHHLGRSQSERIVWLCEELDLDYDLIVYDRSPILAPPELKKLHPSETAPIITDGDVTLAESSAITEYILTKYGHGRLQIPPSEKNYADYLYWLHFANGTLQPAITRTMSMNSTAQPPNADNPLLRHLLSRRERALAQLDTRLRDNEWLSGKEFTAADTMAVVCVSTMRLFVPFGLEGYPGVMAWLERVGRREGYRRAMGKGDPGLEPVLRVEAPMSFFEEVRGRL